jgi:hypothetical protein
MHAQRDAPAADSPPWSEHVTLYDLEHAIIYLRLLDGVEAGADPAEIARVVLRLDPDVVGVRAYKVFDYHYSRALWMTKTGYRDLLRKPAGTVIP